jgi:hypothetical protein
MQKTWGRRKIIAIDPQFPHHRGMHSRDFPMTPQIEAAMLLPSRVSSTTDSRHLEMGLLVQGEVAR